MDEAERRYFQCPKCGQLGSVPHEIIEQALAETPFVRINCATCNHGFPLEARDAHRPDLAATDNANADAETAQTGAAITEAAAEPDSSLPDWLSLPETKHSDNAQTESEEAPIEAPEAAPTQATQEVTKPSDAALNLPDTTAIETAIAAMQAIEPPSDGLPVASPQPEEEPDRATDAAPAPSPEPADPQAQTRAATLDDKTAKVETDVETDVETEVETEPEALGWPEKLVLLGMSGAALAFFLAGVKLLRG